MLLLHDPAPPFNTKRLQRLLFLERYVHQRIENKATAVITATNLQELLVEAGIPAFCEVTERRALERDLQVYADYCDDFVTTREITGSRPVGGSSVGYALDVRASDDAIRYFMGEPWRTAPVKPRLSSAIARCFLLAIPGSHKVEFEYKRVPKAGESWMSRRLQGVPLRTIPGTDSAYFQLLGKDGVFNVNLARVTFPVFWTGRSLENHPFEQARYTRIEIRFQSSEDALAMVETFTGLTRDGAVVSVVVPATVATMTADRLATYLYRTRVRPGEKSGYPLAGDALLIQFPVQEEE